jgi:hypothetical protein
MGSELSIHTKIELQNLSPIQVFFGPKGFGKRDAILNLIASKDKNEYLFLNANELEDVSLIQVSRIDSFERLLFNLEILVLEDAFLIPSCKKILQEIQRSKPSLELILTVSVKSHILLLKKMDFLLNVNTFFPNFEQENSLENRIEIGRMPKVVKAESDEARKSILQNYVTDFFERAMLHFTPSHLKRLKRVLHFLAEHVLEEYTWTELAKSVKVAESSLLNYIHFCICHFILFPLHQNTLIQSEKVAFGFCDLGVRNYLFNPDEPFTIGSDKNTMLQNQAVADVYFLELEERLKNMNHW